MEAAVTRRLEFAVSVNAFVPDALVLSRVCPAMGVALGRPHHQSTTAGRMALGEGERTRSPQLERCLISAGNEPLAS